MSNIVKYLRYHADKVAHIFAGQLVGLSALVFGWEIATLLVVLAGASKEVYDRYNNGTVELADCLATWAGGLLVIGLVIA